MTGRSKAQPYILTKKKRSQHSQKKYQFILVVKAP